MTLRAVTESALAATVARRVRSAIAYFAGSVLILITPPAVAIVEGKSTELAQNEELVCPRH